MLDVESIRESFLTALYYHQGLGETRLTLRALADHAHVSDDQAALAAVSLVDSNLVHRDEDGWIQLTLLGRRRAALIADFRAD